MWRLVRHPVREGGSSGQGLVEFALVVPVLFALLFGIFEAARFIAYSEVVNHATREGARYALVHGASSSCPSGPPPPGETNSCDPGGQNVKAAVAQAAFQLTGAGDLIVFDPVWTSRGSSAIPSRDDASTGTNRRGDYVSVFVDLTYEPILESIVGVPFLPEITIRAESTVVINN